MKNYFLISTFFALLFSFLSLPVYAQESAVQLDKVNQLETAITTHIPAPFLQKLQNLFGKIDSFRISLDDKITTKQDALKHDLNAYELSRSIPTKDISTDNTDIKPVLTAGFDVSLAYGKYYFYTALTFIFSNKYVFYAVVLLVLFLFLHFLFQRRY